MKKIILLLNVLFIHQLYSLELPSNIKTKITALANDFYKSINLKSNEEKNHFFHFIYYSIASLDLVITIKQLNNQIDIAEENIEELRNRANSNIRKAHQHAKKIEAKELQKKKIFDEQGLISQDINREILKLKLELDDYLEQIVIFKNEIEKLKQIRASGMLIYKYYNKILDLLNETIKNLRIKPQYKLGNIVKILKDKIYEQIEKIGKESKDFYLNKLFKVKVIRYFYMILYQLTIKDISGPHKDKNFPDEKQITELILPKIVV